jgi:hypothetical protein
MKKSGSKSSNLWKKILIKGLCPEILTERLNKCFFVTFILLVAYRSQIHERKISLRFLGIILRVLRLEVSIYTTTSQNIPYTVFTLKTSFPYCCSRGGGGGG